MILTDLDEDACITLTKDRIDPDRLHVLVIAVKRIDAWFLADDRAMRSFLNDNDFSISDPEAFIDPYAELRRLRMEKTRRVIPSKIALALHLIQKHSFSILNANCPSAVYFLNTLKKLKGN